MIFVQIHAIIISNAIYAERVSLFVERSFILGFSLYNIVWLVLDIVYNEARYHRQGGGLFFWTSIMLPPILIMLILMLVIVMFFNLMSD